MTALAVDAPGTDVWATSGRTVDRPGDDTGARWTDPALVTAPERALWSAVDAWGFRATPLTSADAPSSTIHSHPYLYDLDVIPAVGECSPRLPAPRHPQHPAVPRRESEPRR
jgi:hypothetical protein